MTATLERIMDDVCDLLDGLVPEEKEMEEAEETGETGAGTEKEGDGEMEVEETLKETLKEVEKLADEVERDVMEE